MREAKQKIVGRQAEQVLLSKALNSNKSEFIAIYGRRRVGKTFLVKNLFDGQGCSFIYTSGMKNGALKQQIKNFIAGVELGLFNGQTVLAAPSSWMEAFKLFTTLLKS